MAPESEAWCLRPVPWHTFLQSIEVTSGATKVVCCRWLHWALQKGIGLWCSSMDQGCLARKHNAQTQARDLVFFSARSMPLLSPGDVGFHSKWPTKVVERRGWTGFALSSVSGSGSQRGVQQDPEDLKAAFSSSGQLQARVKLLQAPQLAWCQHLCLQRSSQLSKTAVFQSANPETNLSSPGSRILCLEGFLL